MTPPITHFAGDYRFLSNFYPSPLSIHSAEWIIPTTIVYPTLEHAFQANKALDVNDRVRIAAAPTPGIAKRWGRKVHLRPDWDRVKLDIMYWLLTLKFEDRALAGMLWATGDAELIEGNTWNDTFWGVCKGVGENHLGKLLMRVRAEHNEGR